jgi:hypothetical protein
LRMTFSISSFRRDSGSSGFLPKHIIPGAMYHQLAGRARWSSGGVGGLTSSAYRCAVFMQRV